MALWTVARWPGRRGVASLKTPHTRPKIQYNRGNISDSSAISYKLFGFSGNHKPQSAFDLIFVLSDSRNSWKIPGKVDNRKNVRKYERLQVTIQFITLLDCQSDWHRHRFNLSKPLIISFVVRRQYLWLFVQTKCFVSTNNFSTKICSYFPARQK